MSKKIMLLKIIFIFLISLYITNKNTNEYTINYDINILQNSSNWYGQIYYKSADNYDAKKAKSIKYTEIQNKFQNSKINLIHQNNITALRLDPLMGKGMVKIKNFTVSSKYDTYKVDFNAINTLKNSHNIKILKKSDQSVTLECKGDDPYLEISDNIQLEKINFEYIGHFILFSMLLYILLEICLFIIKNTPTEYILFSILVIYSLYTVTGETAYYLLYVFSVTSILLGMKNDLIYKKSYIKEITIFLFLYLGMSYMSVLMSRPLADLDYLNSKSILIILASFIPIAFFNIPRFNYKYFKLSLTLLVVVFSLFIIILNVGIIDLNKIKIYDLELTRRTIWTQKNYMFWYVLLMFGTLSFYNFKNKKDMIIIFLIILVSYFALFHGYSRSARLAFSVGLVIYIGLSLFNVRKKYLLIVIWILTLYIIFSPILFSLVDLTPYHHRLIQRDAIYHTAAALIKEHWLFGYGFGSTLHMYIKDFVDIAELPKHYIDRFPGGHPHNLSLLFWLEFGVFGAVFLAYYIHKLLLVFIDKTYNKISQPALFGMIVAFDIITSFSWSILIYQVLLTFSFFGIMLVLSMNINIQRNEGSQ